MVFFGALISRLRTVRMSRELHQYYSICIVTVLSDYPYLVGIQAQNPWHLSEMNCKLKSE